MTLLDELLIEWKKIYKQNNKYEYASDKSDNKAIGMIIGKIRQIKPELNTEEMKNAVIWYFNNCFQFAPKWILENIDLKIINSKFNSLYKLIRSTNPAKKYAENNYNENYNKYGNKFIRTSPAKKEPEQLTEILNNFTSGKQY